MCRQEETCTQLQLQVVAAVPNMKLCNPEMSCHIIKTILLSQKAPIALRDTHSHSVFSAVLSGLFAALYNMGSSTRTSYVHVQDNLL